MTKYFITVKPSNEELIREELKKFDVDTSDSIVECKSGNIHFVDLNGSRHDATEENIERVKNELHKKNLESLRTKLTRTIKGGKKSLMTYEGYLKFLKQLAEYDKAQSLRPNLTLASHIKSKAPLSKIGAADYRHIPQIYLKFSCGLQEYIGKISDATVANISDADITKSDYVKTIAAQERSKLVKECLESGNDPKVFRFDSFSYIKMLIDLYVTGEITARRILSRLRTHDLEQTIYVINHNLKYRSYLSKKKEIRNFIAKYQSSNDNEIYLPDVVLEEAILTCLDTIKYYWLSDNQLRLIKGNKNTYGEVDEVDRNEVKNKIKAALEKEFDCFKLSKKEQPNNRARLIEATDLNDDENVEVAVETQQRRTRSSRRVANNSENQIELENNLTTTIIGYVVLVPQTEKNNAVHLTCNTDSEIHLRKLCKELAEKINLKFDGFDKKDLTIIKCSRIFGIKDHEVQFQFN